MNYFFVQNENYETQIHDGSSNKSQIRILNHVHMICWNIVFDIGCGSFEAKVVSISMISHTIHQRQSPFITGILENRFIFRRLLPSESFRTKQESFGTIPWPCMNMKIYFSSREGQKWTERIIIDSICLT